MKGKRKLTIVISAGVLAVMGGLAIAAQDSSGDMKTGKPSARVRPTPKT